MCIGWLWEPQIVPLFKPPHAILCTSPRKGLPLPDAASCQGIPKEASKQQQPEVLCNVTTVSNVDPDRDGKLQIKMAAPTTTCAVPHLKLCAHCCHLQTEHYAQVSLSTRVSESPHVCLSLLTTNFCQAACMILQICRSYDLAMWPLACLCSC